jgi:hypothetical protein
MQEAESNHATVKMLMPRSTEIFQPLGLSRFHHRHIDHANGYIQAIQ